MPYTRPGSYATASTAPQQPAPTQQGGITFAIGTAPFGTDAPGAVYWSLASFQAQYGDAAAYPGYTLLLWAYLYFQQSGPGGLAKGLMVGRVGAVHATLVLLGSTSTTLTLTAKPAYAGTAGNAISVVVPAASGGNQTITFTDAAGVLETYVVPTATPATSLLALVNSKSAMFNASAATDGGAYTTGTFSPTGGTTGQNAAIGASDITKSDAFLVNFKVTLDGSMTTAGLLSTDVVAQSANYSKPCVGVTGPALGTSTATIETNLGTLATSTGRMAYGAHDGLKITSPATGGTIVVDGFYESAILCGIKCSSDPGEPATNKPVAAVLAVNTPLQPSDENALATAGGTVLTGGYAAGASGLVIMDSVTTTTAVTNPLWNKLVNVTSVDEVVNRLSAWDAVNVVGKRGGDKTSQIITVGWTATLLRAVSDNIIDAFAPVQPGAQVGNTIPVPLGLTANGEADIVNIPVTVS
jgi:hypothetical protein